MQAEESTVDSLEGWISPSLSHSDSVNSKSSYRQILPSMPEDPQENGHDSIFQKVKEEPVHNSQFTFVARSRRSRSVGALSEEERERRRKENETELQKEIAAITGIKNWKVSEVVDADRNSLQLNIQNGKRETIDEGCESEGSDFMSGTDTDTLSDTDSELEVSSWFCTNCTSQNSESAEMCILCNEHRDSDILKMGFLAAKQSPRKAEEDPQEKPSEAQAGPLSTVIGFDEQMLLHDEVGREKPHPDRSNRLRAIMGALKAQGIFPGRCAALSIREISEPELLEVHTEDHVRLVESTAGKEPGYFTSDTFINENSAKCARIAAGVAADVATAIVEGKFKNGMALVRPPGHHAESAAIMGFCLHNNAAVAARAAQKAGAKKILIVDWDVHHGNGTQEIFESDPSVLFISLHRHEGGLFYPGTGAAQEVGQGSGSGFSVNIPWPSGGIGDSDYISAFLRVLLPIAYAFSPELTIISAGFDAARGDPLGACDVTPEGYAHMTSLLMSLSGGRIVAVLEGGYNLRSISASASAVAKVLLGDKVPALTETFQPTMAGQVAISQTIAAHAKYWPQLSANILAHEENPSTFGLIAAKEKEMAALLKKFELEKEFDGLEKDSISPQKGKNERRNGGTNIVNVEKQLKPEPARMKQKTNRRLQKNQKGIKKALKRRRGLQLGPVWWLHGRRYLAYNCWMHACFRD